MQETVMIIIAGGATGEKYRGPVDNITSPFGNVLANF